jgi:hypothetical protein
MAAKSAAEWDAVLAETVAGPLEDMYNFLKKLPWGKSRAATTNTIRESVKTAYNEFVQRHESAIHSPAPAEALAALYKDTCKAAAASMMVLAGTFVVRASREALPQPFRLKWPDGTDALLLWVPAYGADDPRPWNCARATESAPYPALDAFILTLGAALDRDARTAAFVALLEREPRLELRAGNFAAGIRYGREVVLFPAIKKRE